LSAKDEEPLSLPVGWITMELGDLCIWGSGGTPKRSEPSFFGGDIPWVTISDLGDAVLTSTTETITQSGLTSSAAKLISPNSVLVALYGSIGKLGLTTRQVTTNQAIAHAVPEPSIYESRYLFYFLMARRGDLANLGSGVTQKNIYLGDLKSFKIWVAPRAEQTRIVDKLEELLSDLDAGVAELKAAQKKLALYRQSLLKAAVEGALTADWRAERTARSEPVETGADLLARILTERRARWEARQLAKFKEQGKTPPTGWQARYPEPVPPDTADLPTLPKGWVWASVDQLSPDDLANGRSVPSANSGPKVLRLTAIRDGCVDLDEHKCGDWSESDARQFWVTEGDLLIVRGNGSLSLVGRMGRVGETSASIAYPDTMIRLRVLDAVVAPSWINLVWNAHIMRSHIERRARTSAGIYKISQPDITSTPIPVPPIREQKRIEERFGEHVEVLQAIELALATGMKQSTAQRKNLLKTAFSGQLVPQDPNDEPASALLARIGAEREAHKSSRQSRQGRRSAHAQSGAAP
jgi:type I restriction enzyme, S subunit